MDAQGNPVKYAAYECLDDGKVFYTRNDEPIPPCPKCGGARAKFLKGW